MSYIEKKTIIIGDPRYFPVLVHFTSKLLNKKPKPQRKKIPGSRHPMMPLGLAPLHGSMTRVPFPWEHYYNMSLGIIIGKITHNYTYISRHGPW